MPQSYAEAAKWYRLATAQGDPAAQDHLGEMYAKGQGAPQDYSARAASSVPDASPGEHLQTMVRDVPIFVKKKECKVGDAALLVQTAAIGGVGAAIKTYKGSSYWQYENAGREIPAAIATIEIPSAALKVVVRVQKNDESDLHSAYIIKISFLSDGDASIHDIARQDITRIANPQIRQAGEGGGFPLSGVLAALGNDNFIVGLADSGVAKARNEALISNGDWMDIPVLFGNRIGKITFQFGDSGQAAIQRIFTASAAAGVPTQSSSEPESQFFESCGAKARRGVKK